jgi:queuosine biosynthesis protein QueD
VYRDALSSQPDNSVTIVTVGYLTNVADLLKDPGGDGRPSGPDLVRAKVKRWVCMGGNFIGKPAKDDVKLSNNNFTFDKAGSLYAVQNWPVDLVFVGREIGSVPSGLKAGAKLRDAPADNPVRLGYELYFGGQAKDRHVADQTTVLYAVRGLRDYWDIETKGYMDLQPDMTFTWQYENAEGKRQSYLLKRKVDGKPNDRRHRAGDRGSDDATTKNAVRRGDSPTKGTKEHEEGSKGSDASASSCSFVPFVGEYSAFRIPRLPTPGRPLYNAGLPMRVRLSKTFRFEAAHALPTFPEGHKCRRLHGHSFRFDVIVEGEVDPAKGYLIDYGDIKRSVDPIVKRLDHFYLNEIEGLANPTSEVIAKWLWDHIGQRCRCWRRSSYTKPARRVVSTAVGRRPWRADSNPNSDRKRLFRTMQNSSVPFANTKRLDG